MRLLSLILLTLVILFGISFAVLNAEWVVVNYYVGVEKVPLSVLILGTWIFGILIGSLISLPSILKLKLELRRFHREHS